MIRTLAKWSGVALLYVAAAGAVFTWWVLF